MNFTISDGWRRKIGFLLAGGFGFLVYSLVALLLVQIPGVQPEVAAFFAVLLAIPPTFLLQRNFAFRHRGSLSRPFLQYCGLQLVNAAGIALLTRFGRFVGLTDEINMVASGAIVIVFSYLVLSRFVFRSAQGGKVINAQYNVATAGGLTDRISTMMRRRMYTCFAECVAPSDRILDVGVTSDREQLASNYLEAWHPWKDRITACGIDDASFLEELYPGVRFVQANGKELPFDSRSFEWVHASAVLEHVGSMQEQVRFVSELYRVSSKGIFLTTPNRWFPVEFHSVLPLVHWLPKPWFRALLRRAGHHELANEAHLNLLDRNDLKEICRQAGLDQGEISSVSLGGWPSNLILKVGRNSRASGEA